MRERPVTLGEHLKRLQISMSEIVHITVTAVAIWLIPERWIYTFPGRVARAVASVFNPYLSEVSIARAAEPELFIHAHVLAMWLVVPIAWLLIVRRNGGFAASAAKLEKDGTWMLGLFFLVCLIVVGSTLMLNASYPLGRAARSLWVNSPGWFAFIHAYVYAIVLYAATPLLYKCFGPSRRGRAASSASRQGQDDVS
jgi:hypothetical protein